MNNLPTLITVLTMFIIDEPIASTYELVITTGEDTRTLYCGEPPTPQPPILLTTLTINGHLQCLGSSTDLKYGYQTQHSNGLWSGEIGGNMRDDCISELPVPLGSPIRWRLKSDFKEIIE